MARTTPASRRWPRLHRTSLGALALSGASVVRLSFQFAMLPILARLIGPTEYGLVALAMPVILLANTLADGGMGYALGRRQGATRELESTVFWLTAMIGVGLALTCALIAWPMGWVMQQPRLPLLIMALSPILLLNGLTAVSNGRIIREGRFAAFAGGDILSTFAGAGAALLAASHGWGAWSLVVQQLVLWITKLAWVSAKSGAQVGFVWRFQEVRGLLGFGFSTIGALMADFVARNVDSLIIGAVLGATTLGFYAMGYTIVRMPDMLISGPLYLYIFTAASRTVARGDPQAASGLAVSALRLGALLLAPVFLGLALIARPAVPLLLGEKWLSVVGVLQTLAPAGFGFCLCAVMAATAMGLGRSRLQLSMALIMAVVTVAAVAATAHLGLRAASATLAGAVLVVAAIYVVRLARHLAIAPRQMAGAFAPALAGCAVMAAITVPVSHLTQAWPPGLQLLAIMGAGAISYLGALSAFRRTILRDAAAFSRAQADAEPAAPRP